MCAFVCGKEREMMTHKRNKVSYAKERERELRESKRERELQEGYERATRELTKAKRELTKAKRELRSRVTRATRELEL